MSQLRRRSFQHQDLDHLVFSLHAHHRIAFSIRHCGQMPALFLTAQSDITRLHHFFPISLNGYHRHPLYVNPLFSGAPCRLLCPTSLPLLHSGAGFGATKVRWIVNTPRVVMAVSLLSVTTHMSYIPTYPRHAILRYCHALVCFSFMCRCHRFEKRAFVFLSRSCLFFSWYLLQHAAHQPSKSGHCAVQTRPIPTLLGCVHPNCFRCLQ